MLPDTFAGSLAEWLGQCRRTGWRALVHISGEQDWNWRTAHDVLAVAGFQDSWLMAEGGSDSVLWQNRLGGECDCLVIDARAGFNPNAVGMASATIRGGGLLLLLTPPLEQWPDFADPDYHRLCSQADSPRGMAGRFIRWSVSCLEHAGLLATLIQGREPLLAPFCALDEFVPDFSDQQLAIAAIKRVATGHARRPLVLSADRGRGKTAALGMACAELMREKTVRIGVTAVSSNAVRTLFRHLVEKLGLPDKKIADYDFDGSMIRFYAIDRLLKEKPALDLLLIDEAAALPVIQLQQCVSHYNRLVFSTTIDGYEGNGRGFSLRFADQLQQAMPGVRYCHLQQPVRWAGHDPLEKLVNNLLLLDTSCQSVAADGAVALECRELDRDALLAQPALLHQLFGLLIQAHYQTSPDDLRLLLDHPGVRIFATFTGEALLAVALVMEEGGFGQALQAQLAKGRRFRGHILPQALYGDGYDDAPAMTYARVLRIAVQPASRRHGVGRALVEYISRTVVCDFVGASFSAEPSVLRFWQACGLQPARLGTHKESGTGQYACMVLRGMTEQASGLLRQKRRDWAADLAVQLPLLNNDVPAALVQRLLCGLCFVLCERDVAQAIAYAQRRRGFEQVLPALYRSALAVVAAGGGDADDTGILVDRVLLQQDWQQVAERYKLAGRKAVEQTLRASFFENQALLHDSTNNPEVNDGEYFQQDHSR